MNKKETIKRMNNNMDYADEHAYPSEETDHLYIKAIAHGIKYLVENSKETK